ncbi:hypothetical protein ACGFMM_29325 [Streptomyces sp. NPDC048604]|uniref:hypothetical protein n=1 Tax=Streptomyces sp. NPDC048604 TaxID=3365578 RepID=UPI00371B3969
MSASDDQATAAKDTAEEATSADEESPAEEETRAEEETPSDDEETPSEDAEIPSDDADAGEAPADEPKSGLSPRQARRLRVAAASVLLVAMAVVLVVRLASRTSVLVVGVYGLAMILCGVVIELSRNGRTRLGTWLLAGGLLAALAADWLILP